MSNLFISLLTLVLILISILLIFLVLMQKNSKSAGMGASLGGGLAESTFGSQTSSVLTKATIYASIGFFILSLILFLFYQNKISTEDKLNLDSEVLILEEPKK